MPLSGGDAPFPSAVISKPPLPVAALDDNSALTQANDEVVAGERSGPWWRTTYMTRRQRETG